MDRAYDSKRDLRGPEEALRRAVLEVANKYNAVIRPMQEADDEFCRTHGIINLTGFVFTS